MNKTTNNYNTSMQEENKITEEVQPISVSLTTEEKKLFKAFIKNSGSKAAAARKLKVTRQTLYTVLRGGSGSPGTINKIREVL